MTIVTVHQCYNMLYYTYEIKKIDLNVNCTVDICINIPTNYSID